MPKMQVKAQIMLPEGVNARDVDKKLWKATAAELREALPEVKAVPAYTSVIFNPRDGLIYLGLTDHDNELLWTYDPDTEQFRQRHFKQATEKYDVKIHRSFAFDADGTLYTATAALHNQPDYMKAPGGKVFRHDCEADRTERLAIPVPHEYIQTICLDSVRKVIYGQTYPTPYVFAYHLQSGQSELLGQATLPHRSGCDRHGNLWGTIGSYEHKLFRYNPDDGMVILDHPMPKFNGALLAMNIFYQAPDEETCYIGTDAGALLAFDTRAGSFRYLGKPMLDTRIEGLQVGKDGLLYGCGGYMETELFAYDRESERFYNFGPLYDPELDIRCVIPHDMTMDDDGVIYTGETDMPKRSTAALWVCRVEV